LKQIAIALHNYHDTHKIFPPAFIADAQGNRMHSWRALILRYVELPEFKELSKKYDFNQPWNGPSNSKLNARIEKLFNCRSDDPNSSSTNYLAVVGSETIWQSEKSLSTRSIADARSNTILVVEVHNSGINWLEPRDLTFEEAARGINPRDGKLGISSAHRGGANVLFADGAVRYLTNETLPETLRALLTANGGEDVRLPD